MTRLTNRLIVPGLTLMMGLAAMAEAAEKEAPFAVGPAASYPTKQTNEKITIAAVAYDSDEMTKPPFGKANPNKEGVLPVLVVIRNDGPETILLDGIRVEYVAQDRTRVEATPAADLPYISGPSRPRPVYGPIPTGTPRVSRKKGPLSSIQFDVRAFAAKMLPPGQEASGFFYFQTGHRKGSLAYVTGLKQARSGKEIFYFEVPLDGK